MLPYASYYLTGFLHERPLARVREDFDRLGIARAEKVSEPEDHIAILCEVMAGLAGGAFEADFAEQAKFFERHLKPWAARLFADLELSKSGNVLPHGRPRRPHLHGTGIGGVRAVVSDARAEHV